MVSTSENALVKPEVYETKRIQLTSPILHIGSEVSKLSPFEYVQTDNRVYLPNQDALARAFIEVKPSTKANPFERPKFRQNLDNSRVLTKGLLSEYIQAIEDRDDKKIRELIEQAFGSEWWNRKDSSGNLIFPENGNSQKWTTNWINELRPMIRNGFGNIYIPGSSIKGAIRTAIAHHLLKHADKYRVPQEIQVSDIEQKLRQKFTEIRRIEEQRRKQGKKVKENEKKKLLSGGLYMKGLFSDFSLTYQGRQFNSDNESSLDFMRVVKVTDCDPLLEFEDVNKEAKDKLFNLHIVSEVIVSSFYKIMVSGMEEYKAKYRTSIYAEMVYNVETEFELSIDSKFDVDLERMSGMLSWFSHNKGMRLPFQTIDDILTICKEFAQDQWNYERNYWQRIINDRVTVNRELKNLNFDSIREFYQSGECPYDLKLGWGSGMMGTTVNLCFSDQVTSNIRDECGIPAPGFEAPKSRRTIVDPKGEIKFVPGWVKFKVL